MSWGERGKAESVAMHLEGQPLLSESMKESRLRIEREGRRETRRLHKSNAWEINEGNEPREEGLKGGNRLSR